MKYMGNQPSIVQVVYFFSFWGITPCIMFDFFPNMYPRRHPHSLLFFAACFFVFFHCLFEDLPPLIVLGHVDPKHSGEGVMNRPAINLGKGRPDWPDVVGVQGVSSSLRMPTSFGVYSPSPTPTLSQKSVCASYQGKATCFVCKHRHLGIWRIQASEAVHVHWDWSCQIGALLGSALICFHQTIQCFTITILLPHTFPMSTQTSPPSQQHQVFCISVQLTPCSLIFIFTKQHSLIRRVLKGFDVQLVSCLAQIVWCPEQWKLMLGVSRSNCFSKRTPELGFNSEDHLGRGWSGVRQRSRYGFWRKSPENCLGMPLDRLFGGPGWVCGVISHFEINGFWPNFQFQPTSSDPTTWK